MLYPESRQWHQTLAISIHCIIHLHAFSGVKKQFYFKVSLMRHSKLLIFKKCTILNTYLFCRKNTVNLLTFLQEEHSESVDFKENKLKIFAAKDKIPPLSKQKCIHHCVSDSSSYLNNFPCDCCLCEQVCFLTLNNEICSYLEE